MATHLISCSKCCDYVVCLNKVINFPSEEILPEIPTGQLKKVSALVGERGRDAHVKSITSSLAGVLQSLREFFAPLGEKLSHLWRGEKSNKYERFLKLRPKFPTGQGFSWIAQPIPVAVRSGALALLVLLIVSTTFLYRQQGAPISVTMEVIGKTSAIATRGTSGDKQVEKIIKEGDTLFSRDYCRINLELDQDAYVLYYDSTGKLHQLYPDPATGIPKKVKGRTAYTIPEGENNWFQLDDKRGTETVFVLASREPIRDFNKTFSAIQGLNKEEVVKTLKSKAPVVKVLSFEHL